MRKIEVWFTSSKRQTHPWELLLLKQSMRSLFWLLFPLLLLPLLLLMLFNPRWLWCDCCCWPKRCIRLRDMAPLLALLYKRRCICCGFMLRPRENQDFPRRLISKFVFWFSDFAGCLVQRASFPFQFSKKSWTNWELFFALLDVRRSIFAYFRDNFLLDTTPALCAIVCKESWKIK